MNKKLRRKQRMVSASQENGEVLQERRDPEPYFNFKGIKIPIKISYPEAIETYPNLGFSILNILNESEMISLLLTDQALLLNLWHHLVMTEAGGPKKLIDAVKDCDLQPEHINQFREAFWQAVLNFSPPHLVPALHQAWVQVKKEMRSEQRMSEHLSSVLSQERG